MKYYTYWSIADAPSQAINTNRIILSAGLVCLALSFLLFKFNNKVNNESKPIKWLLLFSGILSSSFYIYSLNQPTPKFDYIKYLGKRKMLCTVEGEISNFKNKHIVKNSGRYSAEWNEESFNVDSIYFSYNDQPLNQFNEFCLTHQNGGTLENGEQVKITYVKSDYFKIKSSGLYDSYNYGPKYSEILKIERTENN